MPVAALQDNYIWLVKHGTDAFIIDPGDARPIIDYLRAESLRLRAIIITHDHADHVAGIPAIRKEFPAITVYGPASEARQYSDHRLAAGDEISLLSETVKLQVIATPGHTKGHIALYGNGFLFCGDALFSCGCGRLFTGDAAYLAETMRQFANLDGSLQVCCGHEYTLANIKFALSVEPDNEQLRSWETEATKLAAQGLPTLPVTLQQEFATNPFLRYRVPAVRQAASTHASRQLNDDEQVLAELRSWKDNF